MIRTHSRRLILLLVISSLLISLGYAFGDRKSKKTQTLDVEGTVSTTDGAVITEEDVSSGFVKNVASTAGAAAMAAAAAGASYADTDGIADTKEAIVAGEESVKEIFSVGVQETINQAAGVQSTGSDDLSWDFDVLATGEIISGIAGSMLSPNIGGGESGLDYFISGGDGSSDTIAAATSQLISELEINCAWQVSSGTDLLSSTFYDGNTYTHVQVIPNLLIESVVWIQAQFPKAKHFSYTTYDIQLDGTFKEIDNITDKEVVAAVGDNPYVKSDVSNTDNTEYDIYLTSEGKKGYPNEMSYRAQKSKGKSLVLVFRVVAPNIDEKLSVAYPKEFGYVAPPMVRSKLTGMWKGGLWALLEDCPASNTELVQQFLGTQNNEITSKATVSVNCPLQNNPNNFVYLRGDDNVQNPGIFPDDNSNYLMACGSSEGELGDLTMIIEGSLPKIPSGGLYADAMFENEILVGEESEYDARYISFSVNDLLPPRDTYVTVSAEKVERYYRELEGDNWDRNYRLVFTSALAPERQCGDLNFNETVKAMPITFIPKSAYAGVMYREVGSTNADSTDSLIGTRNECLELDRCSDPNEIERMMGDHYPSINYFMCRQESLNPAAPVATPEWAPYPTKAPTQQPTIYVAPTEAPTAAPTMSPTPGYFFAENWEKGTCAGLVHVDVTSATEFEVFVNGQGISKSTTAGIADVRYGWYPIEETPEEVVVAIKAPANHIAGKLSGLVAEVELCGHHHSSGIEWKCTEMEPLDNSWTDVGFDDSDWMNPKIFESNEICDAVEGGCEHMYKVPMAMWPETCDGKRVRNAYCRVKIASECNTCEAVDFFKAGKTPLPDAFGTCTNPEMLNVVTKVSSVTAYDVFVDGVLMGFKPTNDDKTKSFQSIVSSMTDDIVIAVEASYEGDATDISILADVDICGTVIPSDMNWKCTNERPVENTWRRINYDDSEWIDAKIINQESSTNDRPEGISDRAHYIWPNDSSNNSNEGRRNLAYTTSDISSAFCRVVIPNPVKNVL